MVNHHLILDYKRLEPEDFLSRSRSMGSIHIFFCTASGSSVPEAVRCKMYRCLAIGVNAKVFAKSSAWLRSHAKMSKTGGNFYDIYTGATLSESLFNGVGKEPWLRGRLRGGYPNAP